MLVTIFVAFILAATFGATMLPGIAKGDSAQFQIFMYFLAPAHPPGYSVFITVGKLFVSLPIGPTIAFRANLMLVVFGVLDGVLMYLVVRRVTGQIISGVVAALTLCFSTTFWMHALVAEVYVFYAFFLMSAVYCLARYIESPERKRWLYLTALALGFMAGGRSSELFLLPAFALFWLLARRHLPITLRQFAMCVVLAVLPFIYNVAFFIVRYDGGNPALRDEFERCRVLDERSELPAEGWRQFPGAVIYSLGLRWDSRWTEKRSKLEERNQDRLLWDLDKLHWMLSGMGGVPSLVAAREQEWRKSASLYFVRTDQQGRGSSVSYGGLALALLGVIMLHRRPAWTVLALGISLGNFAFYLYHNSVSNNIDFILPMLVGLSMLAGIGLASLAPRTRASFLALALQLLTLCIPAYLWFTNYAFLDRSIPAEDARTRYIAELERVPLPHRAVIIGLRKSVMTYRYMFTLENPRPDLTLIGAGQKDWRKLIAHYEAQGRPVYLRFSPNWNESVNETLMPGDSLVGWKPYFLPTSPELVKWGYTRVTARR